MNALLEALVEWAKQSVWFSFVRFLIAITLIGLLLKACNWAWDT